VLILVSVQVSANTLSDRKLKLLFLYQFIHFCEWPQEKNEEGTSYKIGIVDDGSFMSALKSQPTKKINERYVTYEQIEFDFSAENLSRYHIIFIGDSDSSKMPSIVETTKAMPIVTVSETQKKKMPPTMIDFVKKNKKIRFRVDNNRASSAGIKFRSQLLRLAI